MVGVTSSPEAEVAQSVEAQLQRLGFRTRLQLLRPETVFTKFCGARDSEVHVCPNGVVEGLRGFANPAGSHL